MRTLYVVGFLVILWQNQFTSSIIIEHSDLVKRACKNNKNTVQRLKTCLFREYDNTIRPNHLKAVTNVSVKLMPKMMEFNMNSILSLHTWMVLIWEDPQLTWTPSDYDDITYFHAKSWEIWTPDLHIFNSGDMSGNAFDLFSTECLVFKEGFISCVPDVKLMAKCDTDFVHWPYDKHQCRVTFASWLYKGEEIDFHIEKMGVDMEDFLDSTEWDFKFLNYEKEVMRYECCPNETYPRITYNFALTRHNDQNHVTFSIPAIVLILLTLTVLWLDAKSIERLVVANVNLICHLLCMFYLYWALPYNGANVPNIMVFYRGSVGLAIFTVILTALLRKLEDTSTVMPNWILCTTIFVLNNKAGRFLILKESKITDEDAVTEENSDVSKSGVKMKESSWRHFAAIIDWLSFFCVILVYAIILISLIPTS